MSIFENDIVLNKAVFVGDFTVGSQSSLDLASSQVVTIPSGASATLVAYEWTTVSFKCQTSSGACPLDPGSLLLGEKVGIVH